MLRIGVMGGIIEHWRDVARRLRGAVLDVDAPESCGAVVLLAADSDTIVSLLCAGKHVLLADESIVCNDTLETLAKHLRIGGPALAVLNRERFLPSRQLLRQQLSQNLGEPGLVRTHRWAGVLTEAHLARDLDLILWMLGRSPDFLHAQGQIGGMLQVHLGWASGGMALLAHAGGHQVTAGYSSFSVIGANGAASADDHPNGQLLFAGNSTHSVRATAGVLPLAGMVQHFVDAINAGKAGELSAELANWRRVQTVLRAVRQSLATGQAVRLEGN